MDRYEWSAEQKRGLTLGSRLEHSTVLNTTGDCMMVRLAGENEYRYRNMLDPNTLQPPSLEFIRQLAQERLGDKTDVIDGFDGTHGQEGALAVYWYRGHRCGWAHSLSLVDTGSLDRFRAAVAAIVALGSAGLGAQRG
jgi:hypothetical protein